MGPDDLVVNGTFSIFPLDGSSWSHDRKKKDSERARRNSELLGEEEDLEQPSVEAIAEHLDLRA